MEKPAAEKKHHFFRILQEEEEENGRLREGHESSSSEPLDAKKLRRMALSRESSRRCRLRKKLETSRIAELAAEEGSSSQEMFAAAGAVPREVMSFSSPFPFFWTSMNCYNFRANCRMPIPLQFAREHLLAEVKNPDCELYVLLENEEGLSWEVVVRPTGLDRYAFDAGWKDFAADNQLKIGDCVIFELVDRLPDSTFAMNFHIRRLSVPVPSPVPVQESNGSREACLTRVPCSLLAQERKGRGKACENPMIRKGGSDNHEKFASAIAEGKVNSFSAPFPSFWISLKPYNVLGIRIPVKFAREHLPTNVKSGEERMDQVLLQNAEGRSWELRARLDGCDKYYLGGKAWKTFVMDNKLNFGDSVLFELIGRLPNATFVMNFNISRVPV